MAIEHRPTASYELDSVLGSVAKRLSLSDLWAAGFSGDEEEEKESVTGGGCRELDLLASMMEDRGGEGGGQDGSSGAQEHGGSGEQSTFEKSLGAPDEMARMQGEVCPHQVAVWGLSQPPSSSSSSSLLSCLPQPKCGTWRESCNC